MDTSEEAALVEQVHRLLKQFDQATSTPERHAIQDKLRDVKDSLQKQQKPANGKSHKRQLLQKAEFAMNLYSPEANTLSPDEWRLSPNQLFVKKYVSPDSEQNGVMLFYGTGIGKTCTAVHIVENFKHLYKKPALVLLPSKLLKANFQREIFDMSKWKADNMEQCTMNEYLHSIPGRQHLPLDVIEKRARKLIKRHYQFMGYTEFVNMTEKMVGDAGKMEAFFSDRVIVVDEVHNMKLSTDKTAKRAPTVLKLALEASRRCKLVLLSATPMFNDAREIQLIMDLLYLSDKQAAPRLPHPMFDKTTMLLVPGAKKLIGTFASKYISYMRGNNPHTFPMRLYPNVNKDPAVMVADVDFPSRDIYGRKLDETNHIRYTKMVGCKMSPYQTKIYESIKVASKPVRQDDSSGSESEEQQNDDANDEKASKDVQQRIQVSNVVYPTLMDEDNVENTYGQTAFHSCFEDVGDAKKAMRVKYRDRVVQRFGQFLDQEHLATYSAKLDAIVKRALSAEGIVFVYSRYLYSGVVPLAIALEHCGFVRYGSKPLLKGVQGAPEARGAYTILSGDKRLSPHNEEDVRMARSVENKDGRVIKVIIVNEVAAEGVDFRNIREVHITEPWFNMNRIEQIVGRAVRNKSHMDLEPAKRNTTIYQYVSLLSGAAHKRESVDFRMYRISENKQKRISQVERVMKEYGVDCALNRPVLTFQTDGTETMITSQGKRIAVNRSDVPFTRDCDFQDCNLRCRPDIQIETPGEETFFKPSMIRYEVELYTQRIMKAFRKEVAWTTDSLRGHMEKEYGHTYDFIFRNALANMVDNRTVFWGYKNRQGYVVRKGKNQVLFQQMAVSDTLIRTEERTMDPMQVVREVPMEQLSKVMLENRKKKKDKRIEKVMEKMGSLAEWTDMYAQVDSQLKSVVTDRPVAEDVVADMVVDRLTTDTLTRLLTVLATRAVDTQAPDAQKLVRALERAFILPENTQHVQFAFIPNTQAYVCFDAQYGAWKDCDPIQRRTFAKKHEKRAMEDVQKKVWLGLGLLDIGKNDTQPRFKMQNPDKDPSKYTKMGSMCESSIYKTDDMKKWIAAMGFDTQNMDKKVVKGMLCMLYEYGLRTRPSDKAIVFARPYQYILYKKLRESEASGLKK